MQMRSGGKILCTPSLRKVFRADTRYWHQIYPNKCLYRAAEYQRCTALYLAVMMHDNNQNKRHVVNHVGRH